MTCWSLVKASESIRSFILANTAVLSSTVALTSSCSLTKVIIAYKSLTKTRSCSLQKNFNLLTGYKHSFPSLAPQLHEHVLQDLSARCLRRTCRSNTLRRCLLRHVQIWSRQVPVHDRRVAGETLAYSLLYIIAPYTHPLYQGPVELKMTPANYLTTQNGPGQYCLGVIDTGKSPYKASVGQH